ncbi:MAG: tripartite tricarboxylate transporter TctB family protein [Bacillota bacterium]
MSKKTENNIIAVAFLLFFIAIAVMSLGYGARARLVPLPIAIGSAILVSMQLYLQNAKGTKINLAVDAGELLFGAKDVKGGKSKESKENLGKKELAAFGVVFLFMGLIFILGIEVAIFTFVTGYFRFINKDSWLKSLTFGIGTLVCIDLLFVKFLKVQFYHGLLNLF